MHPQPPVSLPLERRPKRVSGSNFELNLMSAPSVVKAMQLLKRARFVRKERIMLPQSLLFLALFVFCKPEKRFTTPKAGQQEKLKKPNKLEAEGKTAA
jgi:hypothetical protein